MSLTQSLVSFAIVAAFITIVPGLDTVLVLRAAVARGARHGFVTGLGIGTGSLFWGVGAAVGISALLTASTVAYNGLRVAGAAYMVWLGLRLLLSARRPDHGFETGAGSAPASLWRSWRQGLLTNLLNPKVGAFYMAVLPQFLPHDGSPLLAGLLMALVHDVEGMLWFSAIILGARKMRLWMSRPRPRQVVDAVTGLTLVGFGARLVLPSD
jgi:threonine/homoserine/homoserine lactone efflux protein